MRERVAQGDRGLATVGRGEEQGNPRGGAQAAWDIPVCARHQRGGGDGRQGRRPVRVADGQLLVGQPCAKQEDGGHPRHGRWQHADRFPARFRRRPQRRPRREPLQGGAPRRVLACLPAQLPRPRAQGSSQDPP